jgi:UDP-N-acetyl-2-amino-2-deoxyglucuronate dehydrogenase
MEKKNFAIIGCGGFVAPRHLKAIKDTGNNLVAALDKSDSVGILDKFSDNTDFFTDFERFDRNAEKLKRHPDKNKKIDYVSICSPNYLHDAHIRFALRIGANAICEKPLVLSPWNLDALSKIENETGKRVYTVLQLRLHPSLIELKKKIEKEQKTEKYDIDLTYVTPRGKWYFYSWKANDEYSGGVVTNIGIHFFDMLMWIFGNPVRHEVHYSDKKSISGFLELEKARIRWFLSLDGRDVPKENDNSEIKAYRSIKINGNEIEFSNVFADLHTEVYKDILNGNGFGIEDARPSVELVYQLRKNTPEINNEKNVHPLLLKKINNDGRK